MNLRYTHQPGAGWWTPPNPAAVPPDVCAAVLAEHGDRWIRDQVRDIATLADGPATVELLRLTIEACHYMNDNYWGLDVSHTSIGHLARYHEGDALSWHPDQHAVAPLIGREWAYTVSASVQLSDPDDYDGGDLLLEGDPEANERSHLRSRALPADQYSERAREHEAGQVIAAPRAQGTVAVLAASTWHSVSEVTRGTRVALILHLGEKTTEAMRREAEQTFGVKRERDPFAGIAAAAEAAARAAAFSGAASAGDRGPSTPARTAHELGHNPGSLKSDEGGDRPAAGDVLTVVPASRQEP